MKVLSYGLEGFNLSKKQINRLVVKLNQSIMIKDKFFVTVTAKYGSDMLTELLDICPMEADQKAEGNENYIFALGFLVCREIDNIKKESE